MFDGYDWCELAEHFGVEISEEDNFNNDSKALQEFLWTKISDKSAVKKCRLFLDALIKSDCTYAKPLYNGLKKIKHAETFMKYFIILLPNMWN